MSELKFGRIWKESTYPFTGVGWQWWPKSLGERVALSIHVRIKSEFGSSTEIFKIWSGATYEHQVFPWSLCRANVAAWPCGISFFRHSCLLGAKLIQADAPNFCPTKSTALYLFPPVYFPTDLNCPRSPDCYVRSSSFLDISKFVSSAKKTSLFCIRNLAPDKSNGSQDDYPACACSPYPFRFILKWCWGVNWFGLTAWMTDLAMIISLIHCSWHQWYYSLHQLQSYRMKPDPP